ncbi:MAG: EAL domain-containing protein [Ilumatobacteraceae bacterium]
MTSEYEAKPGETGGSFDAVPSDAPPIKASGLRVTPFVALVLGVTLLAAGLLLTAGAAAQNRQQERTLQRDAVQVSASFSSFFERARSLDLLMAHDRAFELTSDGIVDRSEADEALAYLEVLYPNAIGEACLIDEQGQEVARVTHGVPALESELATNEATNEFFGPTFALDAGEVYQAPPYVSMDTGQWVISNSTWVRLADGSRLIVHFEVSLASFSQYLNTSVPSTHVAVVDARDGRIILQDRTALPAAMMGMVMDDTFPATGWSHALTGISSSTGITTIDGHTAGFRTVERTVGNANDWTIVEWSTSSASLVPMWAGVAVTGLGVVLLAIALLMLRRQQSTLRRAARLDHLTGLGNRKALEEALNVALAAARSGDEEVAVLMIDLDAFKQVNDNLGHDKGDLVLREIARRLHANVFEYDTAARVGGDEFAVVLRNMREADDVTAVAHRLRDALTRPIEIDGVPRFIGASIGAAVHPQHGQLAAELLRSADAAMYRAKRDREGVRLYDLGTIAGVSALGLAAELLAAIDGEMLEMVFQPEISLSTGAIVGIEALARWNRPDFGPVPPIEFIALAEDTGLIRSLTSLTLRLALDEARAWHKLGVHVPVSVNLSGRVVGDRTLPSEVAAMLADRGLGADALVLEITETALIIDRARAVEVLEKLRAVGVRVELDDFGTGYASFGLLQDLPLDGLKIDRSVVVDSTRGGPGLLAATIENAQHRGLKVVAEGVEDAVTLDRVRELGCDTAQGYHLGRPMSSDDVRELLRGATADVTLEAAGIPQS